MKKAISLLAVALLPTLAAAQTAETFWAQLAKCASEQGELRRLVCYDAISESIGVDGPQPGPASGTSVGKWSVLDNINPIDDTRTVRLQLMADEGTAQSAFSGRPVVLQIRCKSGETEVYINWRDYLGSEAMVTSRVGSLPARTRRWSLSTDSQATFLPGNKVDFINALMEVNVFVAQVTPYSESPVTAIFDTTGLSEALPPLRQACGW